MSEALLPTPPGFNDLTLHSKRTTRLPQIRSYGFLRWLLLAGLPFNSTKIASKG